MNDPVGNVLSALRVVGCMPRKAGANHVCRCPAHDDKVASLSISTGSTGAALLKCHAGCNAKSICDSIGIRMNDLWPNPNKPITRTEPQEPRVYMTARDAIASYDYFGPPTKTWTYHNAQNQPVGVICRWDKENEKQIRPVSKVGDGWVCSGMPTPRPLYRLPAINGLGQNARVFVTEGEKAADAFWAMGLVATTSAHGAKAAAQTDWSPLEGLCVYLVPDNDRPGYEYMWEVARLVKSHRPAKVFMVNLCLPEEHDDSHDMLYRECNGNCQEAMKYLSESMVEAEEVK